MPNMEPLAERAMRVGMGLGWGSAKASGVRRGRPPALNPSIRRKKPSDYETKAPPRHHRHAPESLNFSLKYHRSAPRRRQLQRRCRVTEGRRRLRLRSRSPTEPIDEGTPFQEFLDDAVVQSGMSCPHPSFTVGYKERISNP
jgi:hypothetical protein